VILSDCVNLFLFVCLQYCTPFVAFGYFMIIKRSGENVSCCETSILHGLVSIVLIDRSDLYLE